MKHIKKFVGLSLLIAGGIISCSSSEPHPPLLADYVPIPIHHPIVDAGRPKDATLPVVIDAANDSSLDVLSDSTYDVYETGLDASQDAIPPDIFPDVFDASKDVMDASFDSGLDVDSSIPDNGIQYHGGAVYVHPMKVHLIWYGTWTQKQKDIINVFVSDLNQSDWFKINDTYYNGTGELVTNSVILDGETEDSAYSLGNNLSEDAIKQLALNALPDSGKIDSNKVYVVLTSADVTQTFYSGTFCSNYCGWHYFTPTNNTSVRYIFVGNPSNCLNSCSWQQNVSPNGDVGVDAMISVLAHELTEVATDPDVDAWFDTNGLENADKCAWTFGSVFTLPDNSLANVKINDRNYLIQQNWVNANGGYCALKK